MEDKHGILLKTVKRPRSFRDTTQQSPILVAVNASHIVLTRKMSFNANDGFARKYSMQPYVSSNDLLVF